MSFVATAVAVAAVGVGAAAASASEKNAAGKKAGQAQAAAYAQSKNALTQGRNDAVKRLNPYAETGNTALNELSWQLGLSVPQHQYTMNDVPITNRGTSGDKVWDDLVNGYNTRNTPINRPWNSDADSQFEYDQLAKQYLAIKNAEEPTPYEGQGQQGWLNQQYGMDQYVDDPGYTPMVNSLEDLQATPGYQFELQQGLQSVGNSAAAKGSLLSGGQIKDIAKYSQGVASTKYQDAWNRAQQAYQAAFSRDTQNKNNTFSRLQSLANNGQAAAGQQGSYDMQTGQSLAGAATNNGNNQANLALYQGQNNAQMATSIGNSVSSAIGSYGAGAGGGGGLSSWFGGGGGSNVGGGYNANANGSNFNQMMNNAW